MNWSVCSEHLLELALDLGLLNVFNSELEK